MLLWFAFLALDVACHGLSIVPQNPGPGQPRSCDGTRYCTNVSTGNNYPDAAISSWVFGNRAEFDRLYNEIVLYNTRPAGIWPRVNSGEGMCDHVEDYPLIYWVLTLSRGWLPVVQAPPYYQYHRLESCNSQRCNSACVSSACQAQSVCRSFDSRVRVIVWDGSRAISATASLPGCCKCVLGGGFPAEPPSGPFYCDQCDNRAQDYAACLRSCTSRLPPTAPVYCSLCSSSECLQSCIPGNPPQPAVPVYCDQCRFGDREYARCLQSCTPRNPPSLVYCDQCNSADVRCLGSCVSRTPPVPVYCDQCSSSDPQYARCLESCAPRNPPGPVYCDQCSFDAGCLQSCVPRNPPGRVFCDQCDSTDPQYSRCLLSCRPRIPPAPTFCDQCNPTDSEYARCLQSCVPRIPSGPVFCDLCNPFDPVYAWCLQSCSPRSPPVPVYCDQCNSLDVSCLQSCVQRNLPGPVFCDQCSPSDPRYVLCLESCAPRNPPPVPGFCDLCYPFDPLYAWCLQSCVPRNPPVSQVFCDQCNPSGGDYISCLSSCVCRPPGQSIGCEFCNSGDRCCLQFCFSGGFPVVPSFKYCDQCGILEPNLDQCLQQCVCRIPPVLIPCSSCLPEDKCCPRFCFPVVGPQHCDQCDPEDSNYDWCKQICVNVPSGCSCDFARYGSLCADSDFACKTIPEKEQYIREGLNAASCEQLYCSFYLNPGPHQNTEQWQECVKNFCNFEIETSNCC